MLRSLLPRRCFARALPGGVMLLAIGGFLVEAASAASVHLVRAEKSTPAVEHAVNRLQQALVQHQLTTTSGERSDASAKLNVVMGVAGVDAEVDRLLDAHQLSVGAKPESLLIRRLATQPPTLLLAGRDARGLMYAVLEAAEAVRLAPASGDPLAAVQDAAESPHLRVRSLSVHLFNAELDAPWYFDEAYWHDYLMMLAKNRYNTFILTFGDQTNYMAPPFPWWFALSDYPQVHIEGLSSQEQARNYQMLRRITELATEHGLDFKLSIWQQQPVLNPKLPPGPWNHHYGPTALKNLPEGRALIDYNTQALAKVLRDCPNISGLQLRINYESGIAENEQHAYFESLFAAIRECGRPVGLELRYKGLQPAVITHARDAGLDLTISTKFWCEHLGLPYHPAHQDPTYSANRYGYGTLLAYPRDYRVTYQLWNQGSSKLLLWGDPAYAARFAQCCTFGGGEGFEIFAPLTNKGWGNDPGRWRIFADQSLETSPWESQRYWRYYLTFGRMGYNPHTPSHVWRREMDHRFGAAGADLERAFAAASQVLPFVTAVNQISASEWTYWPELDDGGRLPAYAMIQPADYAQFYPLRRWSAAPGWRSERWATPRSAFIEDAIAGKVDARWTPPQISRHLDQLADQTLAAVAAARGKAADPKAADPKAAEFRATILDLQILAHLARYHAAKKRAATELEFFHAAQQAGRLPLAFQHMQQAAAAWREIVRLTDGAYNADLRFGQPGARHWKQHLADIDADLKRLADLVAQHASADQSIRRFAGETPLANPPRIKHQPTTQTRSDQDLVVVAEVESAEPLREVLVHFRAMNQVADWKSVPLTRRVDGRYAATISSHEFTQQYDLLYYLEARVSGGGTLFSDWRETAPYFTVAVERPNAAN